MIGSERQEGEEGIEYKMEPKRVEREREIDRTPVKSHQQLLKELSISKKVYQVYLNKVIVALITLIGILVLTRYF